MPLGENQIRYLAALARLKLVPSEIESLTVELTAVVEYFDQIKLVDTDGVPSYGAVPTSGKGRDDVVGESLGREAVLGNAPETDGEFFLVPKVIG